jgi:plasmid stabilization system protein ParE
MRMATQPEIWYHPMAEHDLHQVIAYIAGESPRAAAEFLEEFAAFMDQLKAEPELGTFPNQRMEKWGWRQVMFKGYALMYTLSDRRIRIRAVVHGWPIWEKKRKEAAKSALLPDISHVELLKMLRTKLKPP